MWKSKKTRTCIVCGKSFLLKSASQITCSKECRKIRRRQTNDKNLILRGNAKQVKKCVICGEEFMTRLKHKKTCTHACSVEYAKRLNKAYQRQRRIKKTLADDEKLKTCVICGTKFKPKTSDKTCSERCRIFNELAQYQKRLDKKSGVMQVKHCIVCGKEFITHRKRKKTCCKACYKKHWRKYNVEYQRQLRKKARDERNKI